MNEFASIIANAGLHQQTPDSQTALQSQTGGGKKFQEVLDSTNSAQQAPSEPAQTAPIAGQPRANVSPAQIDGLINDLSQRNSQIGVQNAPTSAGDFLPELTQLRPKFKLLKELQAVNGVPQGTNLMGRMTQVEAEYNQLEAIMKSNKDLSPGELLGLQARLYQVSQHIEVMSKVVDQVTGGIKTVLNTNV